VRDCSSQCFNYTPPVLVGVYRGVDIEAGFAAGEVNYEFTNTSVNIIDQNGSLSQGDVSTHPGDSIWVTMTAGTNAGKTFKVLYEKLNEASEETDTWALALSEPGGDVPDRIPDAMEGGGMRVIALSTCKLWKSASCDFSSVLNNEHDVRKAAAPPPSPSETYSKCNFTTSKCVLCDHLLDADCVYTTEYCEAAAFTMCKSANITDSWRGINIAKGFKRGEWKIDIKTATVTFRFQPMNGSFAYGAEQVWQASKKLTLYNGHPTGVTVNFTAVPSDSSFAAALGVKVRLSSIAVCSFAMQVYVTLYSLLQVGDVLHGMQTTATDSLGLVKFLYLAFGASGSKAPSTFDAAASSWVLMACPNFQQGRCTW
jgi:hypothetical protein